MSHSRPPCGMSISELLTLSEVLALLPDHDCVGDLYAQSRSHQTMRTDRRNEALDMCSKLPIETNIGRCNDPKKAEIL